MQRAITIIVMLVSYGVFTIAGAQLPPEIMVDKLLIQVERYVEEKDHKSGMDAMNEIIVLQQEHSLDLPAEFHFKYAQVALSAGSFQIATDSATKYLMAAGKEGQHYKEALELLDKIEQARNLFSDVPKCNEQQLSSECWMALANQPECYVWNDSYQQDETVTWTGQCASALAQGTGTIEWSRDNGENIDKATGHLQNGNRHGFWEENKADGTIAKGPYQNGVKHGEWEVIEPDDGRDNGGRIQVIPYVDGKRHGLVEISWPDGRTATYPYVQGLINGRSVQQDADGKKTVGNFVASEKTGVWKYYNSDDSIWKEEEYLKGKLHGSWWERNDYGCRASGNYMEGKRDGDWVECSRRDVERGAYEKGMKQGRWNIDDYDGYYRNDRYITYHRGVGTSWYKDGKLNGVSTYKEIKLPPILAGATCKFKTMYPYVDGKAHGEAIHYETCVCRVKVFDNGKHVSEKKVSKKTCRKRLNF